MPGYLEGVGAGLHSKNQILQNATLDGIHPILERMGKWLNQEEDNTPLYLLLVLLHKGPHQGNSSLFPPLLPLQDPSKKQCKSEAFLFILVLCKHFPFGVFLSRTLDPKSWPEGLK